MASFSGPVKSTALAIYNPQGHPLARVKAQMEQEIQDVFSRSLKAQFADHHHFHGSCYASEMRTMVNALAGKDAFPPPQVSPTLPEPFNGTRDELLGPNGISETVHATMDGLDYNSLPPYAKTLEQLADGRTFREVRIDSRNEEPGSTCVGMSHALLKTLKEKHGIEGMFATQRLQGAHFFCHAAVIIECRDGYVLLDPRSAPNLRIFSIPFEQTISQDNISLTASKSGSITPVSVSYKYETMEETFEYCTNIANGDDLVMKHFMMDAPFNPPDDPAFPISAYYPNGKSSKCIWVSLVHSKLTLKNMTLPKEDEGRTQEVSFQEIREGHLHPQLKHLYDSGIPTFQTPFNALYEQLTQFAEKAEVIKQVFQEHLTQIARTHAH